MSSGELGSSDVSGVFSAEPGHERNPWWWRLEDAGGEEVVVEESGERFPNQSDAESWVGEVWQELLDKGVDAVTLFEADRAVYGPMSLHPS